MQDLLIQLNIFNLIALLIQQHSRYLIMLLKALTLSTESYHRLLLLGALHAEILCLILTNQAFDFAIILHFPAEMESNVLRG